MLRSFQIKIGLLGMCFIALTNYAHADQDFAKKPDVQEFIHFMVRKHHFKQSVLVTWFNNVKIRTQVIQHVNKPLEKEPWHNYQLIFINKWRIDNGVKFWNKYATTLKKAEQVYGVPAGIIVATIGIETKYGQKTGKYRVIDSLSNLAFSASPRATFFRKELEEFLLLTREQHLQPLKIMGSYAGAIGQGQFMPSSYRHFGVNFSKSGKLDLIHNEIDVIGSIANYYQKNGWASHAPVAVQAWILGDRYHYLLRNHKITPSLPISDLTRLGIIPKIKMPPETTKVKVIELRSHYSKEYWLSFHNFEVIKRYNSSNLYAMAVYQLSNYITELKGKASHG